MERRDIIQDQIEQLGRVMGQIVAGFLGLKSKGLLIEGVEVSDQQLKEELDIDVNNISVLSGKQLSDYLIAIGLKAAHLELLSEYLIETAKVRSMDSEQKEKEIIKKAIALLAIADEVSNSISFSRMEKKASMEKALRSI